MWIYIASDYTNGRTYEIEDSPKTGIELAYEYGRGEDGEIVWIYRNDPDAVEADEYIYWDSHSHKYKPYNKGW